MGDVTIEAEVADTEDERMRGLSNRDSLPQNRGMLFVFPEEGQWGFWMKDTRIPLDMIWAAADGTIVTIAKNVRPESYPAIYKPVAPARYVLEVNAGFAEAHALAEGMQLQQN